MINTNTIINTDIHTKKPLQNKKLPVKTDLLSNVYLIKKYLKIIGNDKKLKMVIGLTEDDLTRPERATNNILDTDVVLNMNEETRIKTINGRDVLFLKINFNMYDEMCILKDFGVTKKDEFNFIDNNIFGRFKEIYFDWSTLKFIDHYAITHIVSILTAILSKNGQFFLPNIYPSIFLPRENIHSIPNDNATYTYVDNRLTVIGNNNLPFIFPMFALIGPDYNSIKVSASNTFQYNYDVFKSLNFNIIPKYETYPITHPESENVNELFYVIKNLNLTLLDINRSFLYDGINCGVINYHENEYQIERIKNTNFIMYQFYNLPITEHHAKYYNKYIKYKSKYLNLKHSL